MTDRQQAGGQSAEQAKRVNEGVARTFKGHQKKGGLFSQGLRPHKGRGFNEDPPVREELLFRPEISLDERKPEGGIGKDGQ